MRRAHISFVQRFLKYSTTNASTFILDLSIIFVLTSLLKFHYLISATLGFFVATLLNYCIGRVWVFTETKVPRVKGYFVSIVISISGLLLVLMLMTFFVEIAKVQYLISRTITAVILGILSYGFDSKFTYKVKALS